MMTSGFGRTIRIHLVRTPKSFWKKPFPLQLVYRKEYLSFDSDKLSHLILDSSSKICDLNANTESEVPGDQSVGVQGEAACVQIPYLDLKNVSDGDKWEGFEEHPLVQKMKKEKIEHHISWSKNFRKKSDNLRNSLKGKGIASLPTVILQPIQRY